MSCGAKKECGVHIVSGWHLSTVRLTKAVFEVLAGCVLLEKAHEERNEEM